ncbi:oxygenase MpaB family protein [Nocardia sp. NPDC055049]
MPTPSGSVPSDEADRMPEEFTRYWQRLDDPRVVRARALAEKIVGVDLFPSDAVVREWAQGYFDADPVAEAYVDEAYLEGDPRHGRAMLDQALERGVGSVTDAPETLHRLMAEFEQDPEWVDRDLVDQGARAFRRFGPAVFSFAGATTLMAYTENPIVQPLTLTGAYAGDTALRRFMETARFWIDVSEPGGLDPAGAGRATAMRVRIMHVFIRRRLMGHPEWDVAAWGVPICQSEALITLMAGSLAPGLGLRAMGFRTSMSDVEAMMHFWRYVGHLMGVQPRWYPNSVREGVQLLAAYMLKRNYRAADDGIELVESYPRAFSPRRDMGWPRRIRDEVNYRAQLGYTRFFLPGSFYRRYDLPNPWPWALHPLVQFPIVFTVETVRRRSRRVDDLVDRYARFRREAWWRNEMGEDRSRFEPVQQFTR